MTFFAGNLKAFKKIFLLLFVATFLTNELDQVISQQVENAIRSPTGVTNAVYIYGFLSLLTGLFFPALLGLLCLFGLSEDSFSWGHLKNYFRKYLNIFMIETLRSWGKILQGSLLLIVPGLIRYFSLVLVPFVVTQSKVYDRGEVDALELSSRLVRKSFWKIFFLVLLFHFFIPLIFTSFFDEYRVFLQTPVVCLLLTLLDAYIFLIGTQCFLWVFQKSTREAL